MEKISEFTFEVVYVPGEENVLADALSHMYSNDTPGTVRARSEYTYYDVVDNDVLLVHSISMPVLTGAKAVSETWGCQLTLGDLGNFIDAMPVQQKEGGNEDKNTKNTNVTEEPDKTRLTIKIPTHKPAIMKVKEKSMNQKE